jgi:hypothetical protein
MPQPVNVENEINEYERKANTGGDIEEKEIGRPSFISRLLQTQESGSCDSSSGK